MADKVEGLRTTGKVYLEYDVREYFERITPLRGKRVLDWGCNRGNMIRYAPVDFEYTGIDVDKELIDANIKEFPEHNWIWFNGFNNQYNIDGGYDWPDVPDHDLVLMFSIFTHMDVDTMKSYINLMKAPLLTTFIPTDDEAKLRKSLGYRLSSDLADQIKNKDYCYVVGTPDGVVIYDGFSSLPRLGNVWYFLACHSKEYMSQFGEVIDTPFTEGIRSAQVCLSVK